MPIAFGMLLTNLPLNGLMDHPIYEYLAEATHNGKEGTQVIMEDGSVMYQYIKQTGGLLYYLYQGVKLGIYPPLIFLGVGAMTDFGPLLANPKSLLLGAAGLVIAVAGIVFPEPVTSYAGVLAAAEAAGALACGVYAFNPEVIRDEWVDIGPVVPYKPGERPQL